MTNNKQQTKTNKERRARKKFCLFVNILIKLIEDKEKKTNAILIVPAKSLSRS